jgi:broad specificity phosphatase PhoE
MTDTVWLVRHASTEWSGERWCGRTDLSLSAAGVVEARSLASRLAAELPAEVALVTSPARRARETAEPIARALESRADIDGAIGADLDDGLQEVDFGRAEGWTWADIERRLSGLAAALAAGASEVDWPDGETAEAVRRRVGAAWQRLAERDRPVVAVCHGGVIRAVLADLGLALGPGQRWSVAPASTLELRRTGEVWAVVPADEPAQVRLR